MLKYSFYIAQIISIIAIIFSLISDSATEKKKIYLFNGLSNFFCTIKYALLKGYTGAISCIIAIIRNIIFDKYNKKVPMYVLIIYIVFAIVLQISSINNYVDIIPIFNITFFGYCLATNKPNTIKIGSIICGFSSIIYDLNYKAYISIIYDILAIIICLISYYKIIKTKKRTKKKKK